MPAKIVRKPGDRHGRLTLIRESGKDKWGGHQFLFKCDCGNTVIVRWGTTISCGCAQREFTVHKLNYSKRLGFGEACANMVFGRYKSGAVHRKIPFGLTKNEFLDLARQDCHYCGSPPTCVETKYRDAYGHFVYNGVDRANNDYGYTPDNCVPCCRTCNVAKHTMTKNQFLTWIRKVFKHNESSSLQ